MEDNVLRLDDKVLFSRTVLEQLLADVSDWPDIPEGAVTIVGELVGVRRYGDGYACPEFRRVQVCQMHKRESENEVPGPAPQEGAPKHG